MLSFLMGKRKRRGERSRMGNNHSKIEGNDQSGAVAKDGICGRVDETNLIDDGLGSEALTEAVPSLSSTSELIEEKTNFVTPDILADSIIAELDYDSAALIDNVPEEQIHYKTGEVDAINAVHSENSEIIVDNEGDFESVKQSESSVGLKPTESPITCHEREQELIITRVHSIESSSEGPNQSSLPVLPEVIKCDEDGWGAGQSAAKALTELEKSRKAFFMGLLADTVEEIYPEDIKYEAKEVIENIRELPNQPLDRPRKSEGEVSDDVVFEGLSISQLKRDDHVQNETQRNMSEIVSFSEELDEIKQELNKLLGENIANPEQNPVIDEKSREQSCSDEKINCIKLQDSEEYAGKLVYDVGGGITESNIASEETSSEIKILITEDEEQSDDEESGIVGYSDATSLNEMSTTNTIDERVTDSGLDNDETPDLDEILHTELDEMSMEEFETAGCEACENISIDLVITEMKCDGRQVAEEMIENVENALERTAEDLGHGGNDAKLDGLGNSVETGEGDSDERPRGGLGTQLPGLRGELMAPVHCAIPRDEHRVDMLTLSNGAYETFPRSNLSLASSSDESIGTKVKKHVRWADTDDGRSLESYDSYSSSSSEEEESGSEDEEAVMNQEVEIAKDSTELDEDDEEDDDDVTSESEEESDEEENKTGAEDTFTEGDITFVNVESANDNIDELDADDYDDDEREDKKMEGDETETKTEKDLVEKMIRLQEELLAKAASLERAQSDLDAAVLEADKNRKKIERLQEELDSLKRKNAELQCSPDGNLSCEEKERLESRIKQLQDELQSVKTERNQLGSRLSSLERERDLEIRMVQQALEETMKEQTAREAKYLKEFETERTLSSQRELQMLEDFEWKLRETEKNAKKKVEGSEAEAAKRIHDMETRLVRAEADLERLAELKLCEIELKQLKVTSSEQRRTMRQVTRQFEELQVNEKILQEEVNRLRIALDKEKLTVSNLQTLHKEELAEKDRKLRVKLEVQVSQITFEWEERLRRELAKLKGDLENTHREEKIVAVDMVKLLKEQEIAALKQAWEKKVQEFKKEISNYKQKLDAMENSHRAEIENAQTSSDRDALDLRRKMDKLDMEYQSKIEKMQEEHDAELNELRQECDRKVAQIDSTYQLQAGSTRTTIELVKQQLVNENQTRIDRLQAMHRQQMEEQWEMLEKERRNEIRGLEDAHRSALEQLRKELDEIRKAVTPTGGKQSNRQRNPMPEAAKQMVIDQLNHEATNPYSSCGDLVEGIEAVSAGSDAEKILFAKLQQLTRQANEDKAEIERLRLRLDEKECGKQTQQPQQKQQQHPPHPTRKNRKRRN